MATSKSKLRQATDDGSHDAQRAFLESEQRLQCVVDLCSGYYWEQDEDRRLTLIRRSNMAETRPEPWVLLGKSFEELGGMLLDGDWKTHRAMLEAHRPFVDLVIRQPVEGRPDEYWSLSGQPMFDAEQRFLGYRGIARDVTKEKRRERLLRLGRKVTRVLMNAEETAEALQNAIRAICESEGWEAGQYWCVDRGRDLMCFQTGWSVSRRAIKRVYEHARALTFAPGVGLVGSVWQSGEPLWVDDLGHEQRLLRKDLGAQTGWNNAFLFPVLFKNEVIGVLDFNAPMIQRPDEQLLQVIAVLGAQIGNFHHRALAMQRLAESEERYASTIELAAIGISHVEASGRFVHVNRRLCEMLGYTREELLELTVKDVSHPDDANVTDASALSLRAGHIDSFKAEKRYLRKDGTPIWVRISVAEKRRTSGAAEYDISVVEDISERKRAEARVQYLATHDELTGLPNRAMFAQLLSHSIEVARRETRQFAVLFIDLDRFKIINDSLGHEAGDELLKEMGARIRRCLRTSDVVARLGGDEFVVLVDGLDDASEASVVARNILHALLKPAEIMGQECRITASIGISSYPKDADDPRTLMKSADMAMYLAKEEGKNNFQFYSEETASMSVERLALETSLRRALEQEEFLVHYQAKVDLKTDMITGAEALLRWWSRDLGPISPAQFIPVAEDTGLIVPIGKWVLKTACEQNVAWQRQGLPPIRMAVNLSPRQFKDPNLLNDIAEVLAQTHMDPELLELEITENMVMNNLDQAVERLNAIKNLGVRLAIDDFGTGYSSLSQLRRFPIDTLKVDRSFIRDIPTNLEDKAITEAIIAMGRTLGVTIVAEGVETAEQQTFLTSRECDEMQGFLFSKPTHPDQFSRLLRQQLRGGASGSSDAAE